ncbi:DUF2177 family protein [Sulfitobacter sp. S190]|uniref:DUF2177 family protein n=1 Tax=Sulfitobacter sp. S190 TaxID=2867022 RepID=UPI0021A3CCFA|nr:DUF2177 family protein [Sulfitobacter sp. S190]UWR24031.1 DUF2177 family protein [Sulfitobacter sp. S190]
MTLPILYLSTFAVFLAIDFVGLSYIVKPIFERDIGPLMRDNFKVLPAFVFYAFFVGVLLWFVSWPAITANHSLWWVFGNALLMGGVAYGTYEFTNLAILKDWTTSMVVTDLVWGTLLTAVATTAGVAITRAVA